MYPKKFIREYVIAGFEERDDEIISFIDVNNNNDLSDETSYTYKIADKDNINSKDPKRYPVLKFTYDYFNGYKVSQRTIDAKLTFDPSGYYQNHENGGLRIFSYIDYIHEGSISVNGGTYRIGLDDNIKVYTKKTARLGIAPNTRKLFPPDIKYMAGDTISIGNQYYKFLTHSVDLDTVYFAKLPDDIKPVGPFEGLYAPELTGVTLDGKPFSLKALKGKYVLIHLYSTWCVPCREGNAPLKQLQKKYRNSNLVMVNVTEEDNRDLVEKFAKEFGITWLNVYKKEISPKSYNHRREFKTFMNILGICYLIAPDGKVIKAISPFVINERLIKECDEVLSKNVRTELQTTVK